jgi:AcrR family transcriptional regulator
MARATREDIVVAAAATFAEGGWHGATLASVGARLGLSKSAVLYHFDSKDALLDEVLRPVSDETQAFVASYDAPPEGLDARMDLLSRLMTIYAGHHTACLALQNDRLLWSHGATGRAMYGTYATMVDLLAGSGDEDARLRAHTALALGFRVVTTGLDMSGPILDLESPEGQRSLRICADVLGR